MLALRFADIDWQRHLIALRGTTTKSRRTRVIPIGTERLRSVLQWLRVDADGDQKTDDVAVFSNEGRADQDLQEKLGGGRVRITVQASEGWYRYGESNPGSVAEKPK